jgi:divalent metal cation (Fe/Co/Zn/Cd) transporter
LTTSVRERMMMIARDLGLAIHHVAVQSLAERLSVSAHLEVDGTQSVSAAHDVASRREEDVRKELGPAIEVETHIEPLPADVLAGQDASPNRIAEVHEALAALTGDISGLHEMQDVRIRESDGGEIVNFHCRVNPGLTVSVVHDMIDVLE